MTSKKKTCGCIGCLGILVVVAILIGIGSHAPQPAPTSAKPRSSLNSGTKQSTSQITIAQHGVTPQKKASNREVENKATQQAKYRKAYKRFTDYILSLPSVRGTQQFGDDGLRVFVSGELSDYDVRKISQSLYDQFVQVRTPYMSESDAEDCTVFLYDDTGRELGSVSYYNR